jgi:maltooligosyltrehalose trehalohydrolase
MKSAHAMPFGATCLGQDEARFRLWAPGAARVELVLGTAGDPERLPMHAVGGGWHELEVSGAEPGTRYRFLPGGDAGGLLVPDPASRYNPDDVHGASAVVDPRAYAWSDGGWRGRPWEEAVIYELHLGAFTQEGSYAAAQKRLAELAALGITAIELMPVADFPGRRNWGYDGVLPFAPDASYGKPDELKALIDAAHGLGLMVLLDVVYNHFGPDGNYLHAYCPQFFNPRHHTAWGAAINFDGEMNRPVRDFFVHNALYWVEEYHFDGLRLDAIHAIRDDSRLHIVSEIARALREGPGRERHVHLVLENDANQARFLERSAKLAPVCATAQWNDDLHHAAHVLVTGEADGYYADYADAPLANFGRALAEGFIFQGQPSAFRDGVPRGETSAHLPLSAFVSFLQTHDQIGNRAFGERIHALANSSLLDAAYACVLLSPHTPMLFMGEEFAASTPFLFFCDFGLQLAQAVASGRRAEFKRFAAFRDEAARLRIPDPNAEATFAASRLDWRERELPGHRERLALIRELLALRHAHLVSRLAGQRGAGRYWLEGAALRVQWPLADGAYWHLLVHLGKLETEVSQRPPGEAVYSARLKAFAEGRLRLAPGAVLVTLEAACE